MTEAKFTENPLVQRIRHFVLCRPGADWLSNYQSAQKAWDECPRPEWLLWYVGKCTRSEPWSDARKPLAACALDCAETVRSLWPEAQRKALAAIVNTFREWIAGDVSVIQLKKVKREFCAVSYPATSCVVAAAARESVVLTVSAGVYQAWATSAPVAAHAVHIAEAAAVRSIEGVVRTPAGAFGPAIAAAAAVRAAEAAAAGAFAAAAAAAARGAEGAAPPAVHGAEGAAAAAAVAAASRAAREKCLNIVRPYFPSPPLSGPMPLDEYAPLSSHNLHYAN